MTGVIYRCFGCKINTAGIPPNKESDERYCPICNAQLIHCLQCFMRASRSKKDGSCEGCAEKANEKEEYRLKYGHVAQKGSTRTIGWGGT